MNFIEWFLTVILVMFLIYITIRLGSSAYYRSKREFALWYKKHISEEDLGEN